MAKIKCCNCSMDAEYLYQCNCETPEPFCRDCITDILIDECNNLCLIDDLDEDNEEDAALIDKLKNRENGHD